MGEEVGFGRVGKKGSGGTRGHQTGGRMRMRRRGVGRMSSSQGDKRKGRNYILYCMHHMAVRHANQVISFL